MKLPEQGCSGGLQRVPALWATLHTGDQVAGMSVLGPHTQEKGGGSVCHGAGWAVTVPA